MDYANGEFIQVHPTAIPGEDKLRLMSESARGEGGRVWVPKNPADTRAPNSIPAAERFYFLEEWYPKYGNLVPRDVATRAIHKVVFELKQGISGEQAVYLDLTHIPKEVLDRKLEGILEIYEKFLGVDPRVEPMKVFPGVHYTMGGIWVDNHNQATNVAGIYAAGECEYQYHGANRLGANSLLSCIWGGRVAGQAAVKYAEGLQSGADAAPSSVSQAEINRQQERNTRLLRQDGYGEPARDLEGTRRLDDRARHGSALQQESGTHGDETSGIAGALQESQFVGPDAMVESNLEFCARVGKYDFARSRHHARRAGA